jgi:hypothetical protein
MPPYTKYNIYISFQAFKSYVPDINLTKVVNNLHRQKDRVISINFTNLVSMT